MTDPLAYLDFTAPPVLKQILCWMDGGSVTLNLCDCRAKPFSVEFSQTINLDKDYAAKYSDSHIPGSFLLNDAAVPIRSNDEQIILDALKQLNLKNQSALEQQILQERIAFVESEEYLRVAALMGRM
ncbi:hypothetical protein [Hymenobacter metallicola]|uniref:Uncharacterized protein n=1 Tax=Hymenobacter metallicola TaxID=2563114 RepID=A0A4Z0QDH9_9BACT|nr:hypothetical protein [Hymenobacter metallicola]TGE28100.1 hypothetical protein E5K02_01140 [Hymenobacter metallicola]